MTHITDDIKAILFDHDDTLVDTIHPKTFQHKFIAKTYYNKIVTDEEIQKHHGKPLAELLCLLYGTDDAEEALAVTHKHYKEFEKIVFPETIDTLKRIHKAGKLIGVITATNRVNLDHDFKLHHFPVDIIDFTQTADETNYHKPDPRVFDPVKRWLKTKNIQPNEVLYVGDGLQDLRAALAAGFNFLGVESGFITAEEFKKHGGKSVAGIGHIDL